MKKTKKQISTYSKIQKFLSSLLIFSILFSLTFRVSFFDLNNLKVQAGNEKFYNIVSVIVDKDSYVEIKTEIDRYAKDIQSVLENTKVVILPISKDSKAFNIASLNEGLFYDGYKTLDDTVGFESKLVGTVIVGNFNLPIVYNNNDSSKTILPFTDFQDKVYIYNKQTNKYEKNSENINGLKSEIWHGVISANLGSKEKNIKGLKDYFDKNHDFYSGTGNFKFSQGIINGNKSIPVPQNYEPYVFYYDQFREEKAVNYTGYLGYKGYLQNKEDIVYNRFTKDLANKLTDNSLSEANSNIIELLNKVDPSLVNQVQNQISGPDLTNVPDIQTRHIIKKSAKKFIESFSKGTLGDFRKDVNNAGRYSGTGSEVKADLIPYLITVIDLVNDEITKDINTEIEDKIDDLIKNGLSKKIAIPTTYRYNYSTMSLTGFMTGCSNSTYQNYLYGRKASDISKAEDCSIYRGSLTNSGTLVEANRGNNINLAINDKNVLTSEPDQTHCFANLPSGASTNGWWGGNSILNLKDDLSVSGKLELDSHELKGSITPIFNIGGSKKITDGTKTPSPLNCLENNYLLAENFSFIPDPSGEGGVCGVSYRIPTYGERVGWKCTNDNNSNTLGFSKTYEQNYKTLSGNGGCEKKSINLNGSQVKSIDNTSSCMEDETPNNYQYDYKSIPSEIKHISPNSSQLSDQVGAMVSEALAVDKNRYIDFLSPLGNHIKIDYPALFRLKILDDKNITLDTTAEKVEEILKEKSDEINKIIRENDPSTLGGDDLTLYNHLKTGEYPVDDFDLTTILKNKADKVIEVSGETKTLSYFDILVFSLYWNNLNSVSAKYGFVFDYYLTDQFGDKNQKFYLPRNKKQYEISYLGATGDASNMYVKLDPEAKKDNPYPEILSDNMDLSSKMLGSNIGRKEATFKCAPPDGVPIWEWIPAIICRIGNMLPPTISLSDGVCGPSLLSSEEQDELLECNGDIDKNGINDCIEQKLGSGAILELNSDSEKYYYNKTARLQAVIKDKNGKVVKVANATDVFFELIKIEEAEDKTLVFDENNKKVVYDKTDEYNSDNSVLQNYVGFKDLSVRSSAGKSDYSISFKSRDSNIYLKSYIKINDAFGNETIFIESEPLKMEVRGDRLFNTSYKLENLNGDLDIFSGVNSLKVNNISNIFISDGTTNTIADIKNSLNNYSISEEKIVLFIENLSKSGQKLDINFPLQVKLFDTDNNLVEETELLKHDISFFKDVFAIQKSGTYTIEIIDFTGFKTTKTLDLIPEKPNSVDLNLSSNILEIGGNISTNFVTIYDKFDNPVSGEFFDLDFEIIGDSLSFLDNELKTLNTTTFLGYKVFRLKSNNSTGNNSIKIDVLDSDNNILVTNTKKINVLDNINLETTLLSDKVVVGGDTYKYEVLIKDSNGNLLSNFDSRVYLTSDSNFLEPVNPYVNIIGGKAELEFVTKTLAGENISVNFQVEGLSGIKTKSLTIYPEKAIKLDLILSKTKIEASTGALSNLTVELKDRYNNIVFDDNSTKTTIEILDVYSHIITSDQTSVNVSKGKANYKIYGTVNPGVAYFKISTNPSLSLNSFIVQDESTSLTIPGVGENVGKIETFYFWNKDKLSGKRYNTIYTTLLGSNYGDITQKDYLAGSLLFDKENRSLAVTSLLNNPFNYDKILNISNEGGVNSVYSSNDLSQDIEITPILSDDKLVLNMFNASLNIFIGKSLFNFSDINTDLISCDNTTSCIGSTRSSIFLKSLDSRYSSILENDKLILRNINGKDFFEITKDATITPNGNISFEYNKDNANNYLSIIIKSGVDVIAELGLTLVDGKIDISREESIFNAKKSSVKNAILLLMKSNSYGTYFEQNGLSIFYIDPFTKKTSLDNFTRSNLDGYENFVQDSGIGWKNGNKTLLEFAAGKSVGESVKDYMSFGVINLGDPVISLKKIKEKLPKSTLDRNFDSSIGSLVDNDDNTLGFRVFDYDSDDKKDIILIKNNNRLKLIENKDIHNNFLNKGNLADIVDLGSIDLIKTGDFSGDNYDDIFFVNNKGKPFLLNNYKKDFYRLPLITEFNLAGRIIRTEVFDMDNDNIDDIVTLDESGVINIFYGGYGNERQPSFEKLQISEGHGIKLKTVIRSDNGLVHFDGLYSPPEVTNPNGQIDNLLYVKYPYTSSGALTNSGSLAYGLGSVNSYYSDVLSGEQELNNELGNSYFIRSDYSEYAGIKVEKRFEDLNGGLIKTDDTIGVEITLTNTSGGELSDVAYVEKADKAFIINKNSIKTDIDYSIYDGYVGYDFLVEGIQMYNNESITIYYEVKTRALKHSLLQVGLFEKGEVGDDQFGDIIIKPDNKNCSNPVDIFRSIGAKSYSKGMKEPFCDENKIKLPDELEQNTIDTDNNGIPDYIDELTNPSNTQAIKDYGDEKLAELNIDTDNDGVPDMNDSFNMDGSITVDLGSGMGGIETALDDAQNFLETLSCGFGSAGCFSMPLNWAPLAPGNDPVFMGKTVGDGAKVGEGIPIFSALTGNQTMCGKSPCCLPSVWPIHSQGFIPGPVCGPDSAGGYFGTRNPLNQVRVFVTPTLTGGVGTAICFSGPGLLFGNIPPKGLAPLIPGGNCIVVAAKLFGCEDDGSDGDPASIGVPDYSDDGSFGIINGNCSEEDQKEQNSPSKDKVAEYLEKTKNGPIEEAFEFLPGVFSETPSGSLFTNSSGDSDVGVELDFSSFDGSNYEDIVKINQKRIQPFPAWLMDWVTRQIEEIVNKLTDFPTIYVILPDFGGILEGDFSALKYSNSVGEDPLNIDTDFIENNEYLDEDTRKEWGQKAKKINSGIKEAYEFIGNTPLVKIEQETVDITLPWMTSSELNKIIKSYKDTLKNRETEVERAKKEWSKYPEINISSYAEVDGLVSSLRQNIEVLEEYKKLPEQINGLIEGKQKYLEQILCNIEVISNILGGRIGKNGERFRAWVELYILIKAILKSWQLIVDIFINFEVECGECKNERYDSLDGEFSLIDYLMPSIPVIQFPKWPDIIIDLHNIRAGLTVQLPEYNVTTKPILLPQLPKLYLPNKPVIDVSLGLKLDLPNLPVLPSVEIPELPDIPSIPTINLPDLPPPPKLPKLLSAIEGILNIIELIMKAVCLLKFLPISPEHRAGLQIAFLTERSGYLGFDFLNMSMPEFSFPFIDAIKITSYVNLEFEVDFLVEMARQIAMPINSFSNDFTDVFRIDQNALDFRDMVPKNINIDINNESGVEVETSYLEYKNELKTLFAKRVSSDIKRLSDYIDKEKGKELTALEFRKAITKALSSESITSNPKTEKLRELWKLENSRTFSKEEKLVKELQDNNKEKFNALKDIINTELIKGKNLKNKIKDLARNPLITEVSFTNGSDLEAYKQTMDKYNDKFIQSAKNLIEPNENEIKKELKAEADIILKQVKTPLTKYNDRVKPSLLANTSVVTSNTASKNSCQAQAESDYKYNYEGLYVVEQDTSYRLFNYLDELNGDEQTEFIDIDGDSDEDILYFMGNKLYLKQNLKEEKVKTYVSDNPIVLNELDNKYFNGEIFYEAVNGVEEIGNSTNSINIGFTAPTDSSINNFRVSFYSIVDKFLNEDKSDYIPEFTKKGVIDAISDIDKITVIESNSAYTKRNNLVTVKNIGVLSDVKLKNTKLIDIKDDLVSGNGVSLIKGTRLYAGNNSFTIVYKLNNSNEDYTLTLNSRENIEFVMDININSITGSAYIEGIGDEYIGGMDIINYKGKPLLPGASIVYKGSNYSTVGESYVDLLYYDESMLYLNFEENKSWDLYNLGYASSDYYINISKDNDFYYARLNSFKKNINSTSSRQILLSPQKAADLTAPELSIDSFSLPVFQKKIFDLTDFVYENSGIRNIDEVKIDLDLLVDSDGNGNTKDDANSDQVNIDKSLISLKVELGSFDKLVKKKIGVTVTDTNGNIGYSEVYLNVYSPDLEINSYDNGNISGFVEGSLTGEPVSIYRYRGGQILSLEDIDGNKKVDSSNGDYSFSVDPDDIDGISIYKDGIKVALINESTGKIDILDNSLNVNVLPYTHPSNDKSFTKIVLSDNLGDIYYEYLTVNTIDKVELIDDFSSITTDGIYVSFTNKTNYNYYKTPETANYNPGALSIYRVSDVNKSELFTIFRDARVDTINTDKYKLEYDTFNDYVMIKLIDLHFDREVARVLFRLEGDYIMK